jgi:hypothetical protein
LQKEDELKSIDITMDMRVLASILGSMRSMVARFNKVRDAKIGEQHGVDGDQLGILGELAFCKLMNVWPDLGLSPRSGSADAVVKGYRWDVKTTNRKDGRLLSTLKGNPDVDLYALAIIDGDTALFPGWAKAEDLHNEKCVRDLGHGPGYVMDQDQLRPWK